MNVSLNSFNSKEATFLTSSAKKGDVVALSGNLSVSPAAAGAVFCGVCTDASGGYATVRLYGHCTVPYSGTAPAVGYVALAADGDGGVKTVTSGGRTLLVTDVDATAKTVGIILN